MRPRIRWRSLSRSAPASGVLCFACACTPEPGFAPAPSDPDAATPSASASTPAEPEPPESQPTPTPASDPLQPRQPPPDVGFPRLQIVAQDLAADEGYWTTYEIAASGAFLVNAAGSTGGAEIQGTDCVGGLSAKEISRSLGRVATAASLQNPPPGRSIEDAVEQGIWTDYTISYASDAETIRYVADADRWAKKLAPLMARVNEAGTCTAYLDKG